MIPENELATPALEDDEAEALLDWRVAEVEGYALRGKDVGEEKVHARIDRRVGEVGPPMKIVNDLVEGRGDLSPIEVVEQLTHLLSLALKDLETSRPA
jgi:hypothetical protein